MTHKEQNLLKVWPKLNEVDKINLALWAKVGLQKQIDDRNLPLLGTKSVYEILDFLDWTRKHKGVPKSETWASYMRKLMDETYEM